MGFRQDGYATVWGVEKKSDTMTVVRLTTSRKNARTNEFEQDFSGFVAFVGKENAQSALKLKEKDRIKLSRVDVSSKYDKEKKREYINYTCFGFEPSSNSAKENTASQGENPQDGGNEVISDGELPF